MISKNAMNILEKRYFVKDKDGRLMEDEYGMFRRVSSVVGKGDDNLKEQFFYMMQNLDFLPNSPCLMNAGAKLGQLSACFSIPVEDDMGKIFDAVKNVALIQKSGGGTGLNFSKLRQEGAYIASTGGSSSGPISFMKVFNSTTECIKQGGKRRGASIGLLRVDHPDIMKFIHCKKDNDQLNNFNLSIAITRLFMTTVEGNGMFDLIDPSTNIVVETLPAREIWDAIVENAYKNGEPGLIFIDEINEHNPTPWLGPIDGVNPCSELPLLPFESCNLGSINLSNMLRIVPGSGPQQIEVDLEKLEQTVRLGIRFLNNVIDATKYPLPEIEEMTKKNRKLGLGIMGWADMLIKMNIRYGSDESIILAKHVMKFINEIALNESVQIGKIDGCYPSGKNYDLILYPRNAARTCIAPTGTLSIIAGCSSGIEPLFAIAYERDQAGMKMLDVNPIFKKTMELDYHIPVTDELVREIFLKGSIHDIECIPGNIKYVFVTAHDVKPADHIMMQAAFQQYVDNAVSKTINLGHNATKQDVDDTYKLAYKMKCKGVTVYRDGSRENQTLSTGASYDHSSGEPKKEVESIFDINDMIKSVDILLSYGKSITPRPRPEITSGSTKKIKTGCGNLYITVNRDECGICEVFAEAGRLGGCPSQSEATARVVSIALRANVDINAIVGQLKGIKCPATKGKNLKCKSCPDAIGQYLEMVYNENKFIPITNSCEEMPETYMPMPETKITNPYEENLSGKTDTICCKECGGEIEHEGGCHICRNCGETRCS